MEVNQSSSHLGENMYVLTEKQLWQLLSAVMKNLTYQEPGNEGTTTAAVDPGYSTPYDSASINSTMSNALNTTTSAADQLSDEEKLEMVYYLIFFFLWYGALIFGCLIGFGVYKTPGSFIMYKKFVDRQDIRERLKKEKMEEIQRKKMQRQSSIVSAMFESMSNGSDFSNSCNGGILPIPPYERLITTTGCRSAPSGLPAHSTIYQEEDEQVLDEHVTVESTQSKISKSRETNGRAVFET